VDWYDAWTYAQSAKKQLPSEKQWKQAVGNSIYPWGDEWESRRCLTRERAERMPLPIQDASLLDDKSPWGIYDLAGNVSEWTQDSSPAITNGRIAKGGNYMYVGKTNATREAPMPLPADTAKGFLGFRCVCRPLPDGFAPLLSSRR
jgi:formylglycine-generating enzyme required for sulfatase activity